MGRAKITSVDALEAFRSALIVYVSKARPALEEVTADVLRLRLWLEDEQRAHWEAQMKRRAKEMEMAQSALFSARLGNLREETAAEQMAVHRAKRRVEEADTKLRLLKKWVREFDSRVLSLAKQTEKLHTILANDMTQAVAYLTQALNTLAAYVDIAPPSEPAGSVAPGGQTGAQETKS